MRSASFRLGLCVLSVLIGASACKSDEKDPVAPTPFAGTSAGTSGVSGGGAGSSGDGGMGDDDGGTDVDAYVPPLPPADPEILAVASSFSAAICSALKACVGPTKLSELVGRESCGDRVAAELLAQDFALLGQSIEQGRVVYDDSQLQACLDGVAAMGCAIATDSFPTACEETIKGTIAVGAACKIDSDCEGTAFCQMTGCPSLCAALLDEGSACHRDEDCGDGLVCDAGTCTAPAQVGDACAGTSGKTCALGLNCWGASDDQPGSCHTNAETLARDEGETCEPGGVLCKEGLSCVWNGFTEFHCEDQASRGGPCHPGLPGQCPGGQYCNSLDVTTLGTCTRLPTMDERCVANGQCAAGFACIPGEPDPICARINHNGSPCATDAACRSHYCNAGICEAPPVCGD
jgi:hypothetical protein